VGGLSACDTGLGDIRAGEGVLGLRRAFEVAGAHSDPEPVAGPTSRPARWMKALYAARLERGASTADAVAEASRSVLEERRRKKQSTSPFYWAAFVAAGDWR
jgi:CHAT domain-containing protein